MTSATSGTDGRTDRQYQFDAALPVGAVSAGTSVLVEGTGVDGAGDLLDRMLTSGGTPGEAAVLVSTDGTVGSTARRLHGAANVGLVCCGSGSDDAGDGITASSVGSPGDLTGIGIRFSKVAEAVSVDGGGLRVGVDSVSTLLMYVEDPRSVFRFVHAFTGRIAALDALGLFVVDPGAHDDRTLAMIRGPFDGRIRVRTGERGPELRVSGLADQTEGWQRFRLEDR
ncbi:MAG: hypothetical protein V5A62_02835 [Haloarculaceae archaeon]